jgi:tetratricopeptide (TPR) repeat protein
MTWRTAALGLIGTLLLAACAILEDQPAPVEERPARVEGRSVTDEDGAVPGQGLIKPAASADEAIAIADDLSGRGRWRDALDVIDAAALRFPEDVVRLDQARERLQAQRQRAERLLEDQILVGDAEHQYAKIALLDKLSVAKPDDLVLASRRLFAKELLAGKVEDLTRCCEYHASTNAALARRCLRLASQLANTPELHQRLSKVEDRLAASEQLAAERRRSGLEKERKLRAKVLLDAARAAIQASDYRRALDILDQVAELQPDDRELHGLREEAALMISPQVEALVKLGDRLYLDEQLDAALATWRAALDLRPEDEDIQARIERAETVLNRLDALRREQQGPEKFE